jgi:hypothetical protein
MSTEIKQKTVDVVFKTGPDGKLQAELARENQTHQKDDQVLRLQFSLMGETEPVLSPLATDYFVADQTKTTVYRYDWTVGATPIAPCYRWDWFAEIAKERAMAIQLLIDPGESSCSCTEINAFLLGLLPSKDTASDWEKMKNKLGDGLDKLSSITDPFSKIATTLLKTSSVVSNFVVSDEQGEKNWFLYRFLDEKRRCCAVEWNIHRTVLHQYGPVLRGSILLAFHGQARPAKPLTLLLRPRLNFGEGTMDYLPRVEALESTNPVALAIHPLNGNPLLNPKSPLPGDI